MRSKKNRHTAPIRQELNLGDPQCFESVFHKLYPALCFYAQRLVSEKKDAEDIVETFFAKAWEQKKNFESESHLKAYCYRCVKNACLTFIQQKNRSQERHTTFFRAQETIEKSCFQELIRAEVIAELHRAIAALPKQCQKVIRLSYLEGLDNRQIAAMLSLSVQTVKNHKLRGLALLRKELPSSIYTTLPIIVPVLHNWLEQSP